MFFLSDDDRYLVKTMRKSETKLLFQYMPQYFRWARGAMQQLVPRQWLARPSRGAEWKLH